MKNGFDFPLLMAMATWGALGVALVGTLLGLLAQLWPRPWAAGPSQASPAARPARGRATCVPAQAADCRGQVFEGQVCVAC